MVTRGKDAVMADRARQEAEAKRRAGDEADAEALDLRQKPAADDAHVHHVEVGLDDRDLAGPQRLLASSGPWLTRPMHGSCRSRPPRQRLAHSGAATTSQRRIVELQEVEIGGAEPRQAALGRGDDRRREKSGAWSSGLVACLVVMTARERLPSTARPISTSLWPCHRRPTVEEG